MQNNCVRRTLVRICIENASLKMPLSCIFALHHLFLHLFAKMCFLPTRGAQLCKTTSNTFDQKSHFFDPQTGSKCLTFVNFACSCRFVVRSLRYVLAPGPLQKQPVARLPCCFRLQAPFAKTIVWIKIAILWMSCAICYFLSAFNGLQSLLFPNFFFFCKICFPPSVRSTFLKISCKQSALINVRFGSLLGAFPPWVPLRRALIRPFQCCSRSSPGNIFHKNPFCTHYWLFIFAISLNLLCCFGFWCLLACFFFIFLSKLWKCALCHGREHIFATRLPALSIKNIIFLTPKRPQKHYFLLLLLVVVALLLVRFVFCSLHAPFKNSLWLDSRAVFASRAPSPKATACNTPAFL